MTSPLRGILFDFNGTLFFDSTLQMEAFHRYFRMRGRTVLPTMDEMVQTIFGRANDRIYRENFNPDATAEEIESFAYWKEKFYCDLCLEKKDLSHLVEGATDLLNYLSEHQIPFCLATGSPHGNVEFYRQHLGLDQWFSFEKNIVCCDGSFPGKPDPAIYRLAAKKIGLPPEECLIFEDGPSGLRAANAAPAGGVVCIYEKGLPSPMEDGIIADGGIFHDLTAWKEILSQYGLKK